MKLKIKTLFLGATIPSYIAAGAVGGVIGYFTGYIYLTIPIMILLVKFGYKHLVKHKNALPSYVMNRFPCYITGDIKQIRESVDKAKSTNNKLIITIPSETHVNLQTALKAYCSMNLIEFDLVNGEEFDFRIAKSSGRQALRFSNEEAVNKAVGQLSERGWVTDGGLEESITVAGVVYCQNMQLVN